MSAKSCAITGKSTLMGGGYSNRVRANKYNPTGKRRRYANLQRRSYFIPELNKTMIVTLSARGIRIVNKKGPYKAFKEAGIIKAIKPKAQVLKKAA